MEWNMSIWNCLSCVIGSVAILYIYLKIKYSYWERRGIPSVKGVWFLGSYGRRWKEPQGQVELEWYKKYGRLFGIYEGLNPVLMVSEPELVKEVLVRDFNKLPNQRDWQFGNPILDHMIITLEGNEWKRVKSLMTPIFSTGKIKKMTKNINDSLGVLEKNLREIALDNKPVNCTEYFNAFVMDTISRCAFSIVIDSHNDPKNPFVRSVTNIFDVVPWRVFLTGLFPNFCKFFKISIISAKDINIFHKTVIELLQQRREQRTENNDFLQYMLDTSESSTKTSQNGSLNIDNGNNHKLNQDEIVSQCVLLFLVGFVTTAANLGFAIYNLASHPHCQEKLAEEIEEVMKDKKEISYEDVHNMKYLDAFISETLRYYTPVMRVDRKGYEDYKLGDTGITVPKNMLIGIPIYAIHHDPEWFPEPEKFDPDRFLPENKNNLIPYTYLPFGVGPRSCLGMKFTLLEMKLCLAHVVRHFRFSTCTESKLTMDFGAGLEVHRPKEAIVKIEERHKKNIVMNGKTS